MIQANSDCAAVLPVTNTLDKVVAVGVIVLLSPLWLLNCLIAVSRRKPVMEMQFRRDDLNRGLPLPVFTCGLLRSSAYMLSVLRGELALVGIEIEIHNLSQYGPGAEWYQQPTGIFSVYGTLLRVGYVGVSPADALDQQCKMRTVKAQLSIISKAIINRLLYSHSGLECVETFSLFGLQVNNMKLQNAVSFAVEAPLNACKKLFFINVNSVNLARNNQQLACDINAADLALVDGSGVRMAARMQGIRLLDNINGTDFLPHLCRAMARRGQRIYLLGSAPGVAEQAAYNLKTRFPTLQIAGHYHGYFDESLTDQVIDMINLSDADILLVAQGSPRQERWINQYADKLNVRCALAVGGLLDFTSGRIPRAPQWLCEIGMEWLYRLWQEPYKKFSRYVVGNPVFIARCLVQKFAKRKG